MILHRLRLAAPLWIIVIPLWILVIPLCILVIPQHPPLILVHLQELLSPCPIPRSPGEGGEGGTAAQPMRIQRPAQPPQWPRMSAGSIGIRHPRERPSINQWPVTPPRWWVPQCTKIKASTPFICHRPLVPATNRNAVFQFGLDRCRFPGLYNPALPDPSQDLTANPSRVNNSGSGLSSPSLLQPCTKPFSGRPARPQMTCPTREAGEAIRERPGAVYPLLPRAQHPDTRVVIEAALPEAAALDRRAQPPTVVEIDDTSLPQQASSPRIHASRR